jgi:hypothetical protein
VNFTRQIAFQVLLALSMSATLIPASASANGDAAAALKQRQSEARAACGAQPAETDEDGIDTYQNCRFESDRKVAAEFAAEQKAKEDEDAAAYQANETRRMNEAAAQNTQEAKLKQARVELATLGEKCEEETKSATETCNFNKNKEAQMAMGLANQFRGQIQAMAMSSPALMCSKMGSISQALDGAVAAFSGYCTTAYGSCDSACSDDMLRLKAMKENPVLKPLEAEIEKKELAIKTDHRSCNKLAGNVQNVFQNIGAYAQMEAAKSQYCGEKTDALAQLCKSQPGNALCKTSGSTNCADPNVAASSVVCICSANPSDPRCGAQNAVGLNAKLGSSASSGGGSGGADKLDDFGGMGGLDGPGGPGFNGQANTGDAGGSGGGARSGFGGRNGGGLDMGSSGQQNRPGAAAAAGGNPNAQGTKIISGYGVGGGGSSGSVASRTYGSGTAASGTPGTGNGYYGAPGAKGKPVDLKQFLPGGQMDPSRGLAGAAGPDGITGPNSDIWKKIKMRYYSVTPSLLP